MYGENTKYHSNPYIQGTTVPCDTQTITTHKIMVSGIFIVHVHVALYVHVCTYVVHTCCTVCLCYDTELFHTCSVIKICVQTLCLISPYIYTGCHTPLPYTCSCIIAIDSTCICSESSDTCIYYNYRCPALSPCA